MIYILEKKSCLEDGANKHLVLDVEANFVCWVLTT